ncbi:MAG: LLM class flavin-dependent oxidoreductase [Bacteroidota bacterium]
MEEIKVKSKGVRAAEISWFAPICNGDDEFLAAHDDRYKSTWTNASKILLKADELGYKNILCPSSYQVGQDTLTFASAVAPFTQNINLLTAIRCGEIHPPMLARALATLDHMLKGRLTINIISSNLPGEDLASEKRYQKSREVIQILKQCWTQEEIDFAGEYYTLKLPTDPVKPYQQNGGPLLYFGGYSPAGQDLCAEFCDVYLMWPEAENRIINHMKTMSQLAEKYNRVIDFGLRVHVIVRETEEEAKAYAGQLMSKVNADRGDEVRGRALDAKSLGVAKQSAMREAADNEGFIEPHLWTEIGKARSGCGAALVGNPEQIISKINRYMDLGIRSFIFSGYPHLNECQLFAKHVLPHIPNISLPQLYERVPKEEPLTPLGAGKRS